MTSRPRRLVVCLGTGTEVGKTWVGAATLAELRRAGTTVAARKPVQSFEAGDPFPTDARWLADATGEPVDLVCPAHRDFTVALAPPMATEVLGLEPIALAELVDEIDGSWVASTDLGWVEAAGGVRSPIAHDGDGVALVQALRPDAVVLVADAELGTLNAVRLCLDALAPTATEVVVVLNRFDPTNDLHRRNLEWLAVRDGATVVTDTGALAERLSRERP